LARPSPLATFEERAEFVHKYPDDIFDSVVNPLTVSLVPFTQAPSVILRRAVLSDVPSPLRQVHLARSLLVMPRIFLLSSWPRLSACTVARIRIPKGRCQPCQPCPSVEDESAIYVSRLAANLVNAKNFEVSEWESPTP
jgi:hypothetical protein